MLQVTPKPLFVDIDPCPARLRQDISRVPGIAGVKMGDCVLELGVKNATRPIPISCPILIDLKHGDTADRMVRLVQTYTAAKRARLLLTISGVQSEENLRSAVTVALEARVGILVTTVLSDWTSEYCTSEFRCDLETKFRELAQKAARAKPRGITCPGYLLPVARTMEELSDVKIFATGIRSVGVARGEHYRPVPPEQALQDGADWIVVGREVTDARDPLQALKELVSGLT